MKYVLIVLAVLLLLILLLLFSRLSGGISYSEQGFQAYIRYWKIKKQIFPRKQRKKAKNKKKESTGTLPETSHESSKEPQEQAAQKEEKAEKETRTDVLNLLRKQVELISTIKGRLTITRISIKMEIGTGDAAETAVLCGSLYAAVFTILGFAQNIFFVNKPEVVINPDYGGKTAKGEYQAELSARVITYIRIAIKAFRIYSNDK